MCVPMNPWCNALDVLKKETLQTLQNQLSPRGINWVDALAVTSPDLLRKMEADGTLLAEAKQVQSDRDEVLWRARNVDGMTHLCDREILEMYGTE